MDEVSEERASRSKGRRHKHRRSKIKQILKKDNKKRLVRVLYYALIIVVCFVIGYFFLGPNITASGE